MGIFDRFRDGLGKTRKFISESITRIAAGMGSFDEEMLDEFEMTLVSADTGSVVAMRIIDKVRAEIKRSGGSGQEFVVSVIKTEMLDILGPARPYSLEDNKLNIIILAGVNGTGKTTTAGKMCLRYMRSGKKVILAAADTFRAAAIEQLKHWGDLNGAQVIAHETGSDPGAVVYDAVHAAINRKADVLIIDTAGRLHNKKNLMEEFAKIERITRREAPDARIGVFLVVDATTGQNAVVQAKIFNEATVLDGVILTKLDSNAKGGIALAVAAETSIPIVMAGLGERAEDLVDFEPEPFVDSLFG